MKVRPCTREHAARLLRSRGVTPTRQRVEIAQALFLKGEHVSAEQVLKRVNWRGALRVSKATVYNTLNLLLAKNLVRQVLVDPGRVFYDPNVEPHHHIYDVDTGQLRDIDAADVRVSGLPCLPEGVVSERVDIIVRVRSRTA